jgi:hypothetical protein
MVLCDFMSAVCVKFHSEKVLMFTDCVLNRNSRLNLTSNVMCRTRHYQTDLDTIKCWSDRTLKVACAWVCETSGGVFTVGSWCKITETI